MLIPAYLRAADHGYGPLPPRPLPDVQVTTQDGTSLPLPTLVQGKAVAVQFIFTNCTTACPLLGSLFRLVEKRIGGAPDTMLLSVSVDPARDGPLQLREWLSKFKAGGKWQAVTLPKPELERLLKFFGGNGETPTGHSAQIFFVSRQGDLVARTVALPDSASVASELEKLR